MTRQQKLNLQKLKRTAIKGMLRYMKYGGAENKSDPDYDPDFDAGYTQKHVDRCAKILDEYLDALQGLSGTSENEEILNSAKKTVLRLNKLNNECDGSLIETGQREEI